MENTTVDKATKGILANSLMEFTDPGFNSTIMQKIQHRRSRKVLLQNFFLYFFILLLVEVAAFIIISSMHPDLSGFASLSGKLGMGIIIKMGLIRDFIIQNGYFLMPFIVLFIFKKIMDSRLRYS